MRLEILAGFPPGTVQRYVILGTDEAIILQIQCRDLVSLSIVCDCVVDTPCAFFIWGENLAYERRQHEDVDWD